MYSGLDNVVMSFNKLTNTLMLDQVHETFSIDADLRPNEADSLYFVRSYL